MFGVTRARAAFIVITIWFLRITRHFFRLLLITVM
jgi:hypothetical protein